MRSISELFALPRYAGTLAAMVRCTNITAGFNKKWLEQNKTGTWSCDFKKRNPETIIVLLDSDDVDVNGIVEVWAGRFTKWTYVNPKSNKGKGFFHVDCFERVGFTKKIGLSEFCAPFCKGPQPVPVYLQSKTLVPNQIVNINSIDEVNDDFAPEFSGEKEGTTPGKYTANCVHGTVVTALYKLLKDAQPNCKISNRRFYDLLMQSADQERVLFEVKTNSSTQSVYTGIGQLFAYNLTAKANHKVLVLPHDGEKWKNQLADLGIKIWTYELAEKIVRFQALSPSSGLQKQI